jgi:DNA polymerase III epsilon subunit-like protein
LRWIFEALAGGDLSGIDPEWFASKSSNKPEDQLPYIKAELAQIIATLRTKNHFLVGHNIFTDLGFIYNAFVGRLPAKVEEFQKEIHFLFPTVIDTKYLASHGADSMNPRANLKDLLDPFRKVHIPLIVLHEQHTAYGGSGKEHEAGFDSWMTAELFVKLTAKLYSTYDGTSMDGSAFTEESAITNESAYVSGSAYFSASAETLYYSDDDDDSPGGGAFLNSRSATPSPKKNASKVDARSGSHSAALPSGNLNAGPLSGIPISTQTQSKSSAYSGSLNGGLLAGLSMSSQFQSTVNTGSGALKNGSLSALSTSSQSTITAGTRSSGGVTVNTVNGNSSSAKSAVPKPILNTKLPTPTISRREPTNRASMVMQDNLPPAYHAKLLDPSAITLQDNDEDTNAVRQEPFVQQWIPGMEHLFWGPYVNKLRVNAAEGGVCELAAEEK